MERERERERERGGDRKGEKGAHGRITGGMEKRTDGNRSRQFMQPLPQVNAASDTLRYADLKALLDSAYPPPFSLSRSCKDRLSSSSRFAAVLRLLRKARSLFIPFSRRGKYRGRFFTQSKDTPCAPYFLPGNKGNTFERGAPPLNALR